MAQPQHQALGPDNPWPGLDPFDETDREYFHGRSAESGDLLRLVRRELLTVLFGRSGLGKTSLLKAGLFPLLREEDGLPVYVRLDHAEGAPTLREQIYRGLRAEGEANRVQASHPAEDETLWSFFHRRDAEFWSERNRPVTPVIVFDQFEEIFTLGQEKEAARVRSASFLAELSDLIENRPPDAVKRALEADPAEARRFDFKRSAAKVVLSFREDFLAEMEGLKESIPSLMYNRYRLLAMRGSQAYEVITRAGGILVDDEVARRILRLAWKNEPSPPIDPSDFPKIEIDPALLSVVCTELNHKRQQAEPPLGRITPELLEGADREILSDFYERSMAGLDPRVRAFVEDELITDRGYRDNHALEDALALPGVTAEAIGALTRNRLLSVDERQSVRRLELTHDVLARVVKESRDSRRAREAEEAAKARERAAREQQRRNRRNAVLVMAGAFVVVVLMVLAVWFAWEASQAQERAAQLKAIAKIQRNVAQAQRQRAKDATAKAIEQQHRADIANSLVAEEKTHADQERERAAALKREAEGQKRRAAGLLRVAKATRLMATADRIQDTDYDASLLTNLEAARVTPTFDAQIGLLERFVSHPHLATFLRGHEGVVFDVAFSPDGKRLVSASEDKTVRLWDVDDRRPPVTLPGGHGSFSSVAFSGNRLAAASHDGTVNTVILWDLSNHKLIATLKKHKDLITSIAVSPDGKLLASASEDKTVILWDMENYKKLHKLEHKNGVWSVAFSPDGKQLASAGGNNDVILWDVNSGKALAPPLANAAPVHSVAFSADGTRLAAASDKAIILWDVANHQRLAILEGHKEPVLHVTFSPDGKLLASTSWDKTVVLWDVDSGNPLATLEGHKDGVNSVAFSSDGKKLASASRDKTVILWDVDAHKPLTILGGPKPGSLSSVAFSPSGKRLAAASVDNVILWDMDSLKPLDSLAGHKDRILDITFSPAGKWLAVAVHYNNVILWDMDNRKPIDTSLGSKYQVLSVAFSLDGKRLVAASRQTMLLWDVDRSKQLTPFELPEGWAKGFVLNMAFSPEGKRLASVNEDGTVILWDVDSRKPLTSLATQAEHKSKRIAFSPDGKRLASANEDGTVTLWGVDNHKLLPLATLKGHKSEVFRVAFSPDGKRLASASLDKTVILWDVDSRKLLVTLKGHNAAVISVAFSLDGKRLASASWDNTVILWDLDLGDLKAEACRTANRNLTCEEWRSHIGIDQPYHKTCPALPGPEKCD